MRGSIPLGLQTFLNLILCITEFYFSKLKEYVSTLTSILISVRKNVLKNVNAIKTMPFFSVAYQDVTDFGDTAVFLDTPVSAKTEEEAQALLDKEGRGRYVDGRLLTYVPSDVYGNPIKALRIFLDLIEN